MKAKCSICATVFLFLICFYFSPPVYSQVNPPTPTCAVCGGKNGVHELNTLIDLFNSPVISREAEAEKEEARKAAAEDILHIVNIEKSIEF